jgi:ArsR family transcriptional regulator
MERIGDAVGEIDTRLYAEVLSALAGGTREVAAISRDVEAPPELVEEALEWLADRGVAERRADGWRLSE